MDVVSNTQDMSEPMTDNENTVITVIKEEDNKPILHNPNINKDEAVHFNSAVLTSSKNTSKSVVEQWAYNWNYHKQLLSKSTHTRLHEQKMRS